MLSRHRARTSTTRTPTLRILLFLTLLMLQAGCLAPQVSPTPTATRTPKPPTAPATATQPPTATVTPTVATTGTPASTSVSPVVALSPTSGPGGTEVVVTASGFRPDTTVAVGIAREGAMPEAPATAQTDGEGKLTAHITVPEAAETGDRWAVVVQVVGQPIQAVSNLFQVGEPVAAATATPTRPAGGPTVLVYLIGLESAGDQAIGCGDAVVPVEVSIAPTVAVLRAALEELLAIKEQTYGESGLYNALYQSELTVGELTIVEGKATIHLSGELLIGGTCDAPRVKAQLEATARQFSTVDEVSVYVNGTPLDSVLSGL